MERLSIISGDRYPCITGKEQAVLVFGYVIARKKLGQEVESNMLE